MSDHVAYLMSNGRTDTNSGVQSKKDEDRLLNRIKLCYENIEVYEEQVHKAAKNLSFWRKELAWARSQICGQGQLNLTPEVCHET